MANVLISDLTAGGALAGAEVFEIEVGGVSYKVTSTQIQTFVLASYAGASSISTLGTITTGTISCRVNKRTSTVVSSSNITVNSDLYDVVRVDSLATDTTINNPTGTAADGQELTYRIESDATPRVLTFQSDFRFSGDLTAPATTSASKTIYIKFEYNRTASKWDCVSILDNF